MSRKEGRLGEVDEGEEGEVEEDDELAGGGGGSRAHTDDRDGISREAHDGSF